MTLRVWAWAASGMVFLLRKRKTQGKDQVVREGGVCVVEDTQRDVAWHLDQRLKQRLPEVLAHLYIRNANLYQPEPFSQFSE